MGHFNQFDWMDYVYNVIQNAFIKFLITLSNSRAISPNLRVSHLLIETLKQID